MDIVEGTQECESPMAERPRGWASLEPIHPIHCTNTLRVISWIPEDPKHIFDKEIRNRKSHAGESPHDEGDRVGKVLIKRGATALDRVHPGNFGYGGSSGGCRDGSGGGGSGKSSEGGGVVVLDHLLKVLSWVLIYRSLGC